MSSGDMGDDAPCFLLSTGYKVTEWRLQTHAKVSKELPAVPGYTLCHRAEAVARNSVPRNAFAPLGLYCRDRNRSSYALVVVYLFFVIIRSESLC